MEIQEEICNCIYKSDGIISNGYYTSARFDKYPEPRINKAIEQAKLKPASVGDVITYTNEFLLKCGMNFVACPKISNPEVELRDSEKFYNRIKDRHKLDCRRDIVWMKFTKDGYLVVVAGSDDINFQIPTSKSNYTKTNDGNQKSERNKWKYNNSGIIVHRLGKSWCKNYLLVFPLIGIQSDKNLTRGHIECGVGNYLINKKVPILDYYSHRFQDYFPKP